MAFPFCTRSRTFHILLDRESSVTNVTNWYETANGSPKNVTAIRCDDDRTASPFMNGSFVVHAEAVDNDVFAVRAGGDKFEHSEIRFWNESVSVTLTLRIVTVKPPSAEITQESASPFTVILSNESLFDKSVTLRVSGSNAASVTYRLTATRMCRAVHSALRARAPPRNVSSSVVYEGEIVVSMDLSATSGREFPIRSDTRHVHT
jgi:hypothetical protein